MPLRDVLTISHWLPIDFIAASNDKADRDALNSLVVDFGGNAQVLFPQSEMPVPSRQGIPRKQRGVDG